MDSDTEPKGRVSTAGESAYDEAIDVVLTGIAVILPLAPNPVMGGFLTHMPEDRVMDVDMTVEEGVRNIITSGIGTQGVEEGMTEQQLEAFGFDPDELDGFSGDTDEGDDGDAGKDSNQERTGDDRA